MKLKQLKIRNFRGLEKLDIRFHPDVTVIVGRNGVGKTTILDAIAKMLLPLNVIWPNDNGAIKTRFNSASIGDTDVRTGASDCSIFLKIHYQDHQTVLPNEFEVSVDEKGKTNVSGVSELWQKRQKPDFVAPTRPLFVYYNQNRGFESAQKSTNVFSADTVSNTSLAADLKAISDLETWWDKRDAQEARQVRDVDSNYRDPQLEAIRKLVQSIDTFEDIYYSVDKPIAGLYFKKRNGESIHVSQLSSGERTYLILLADLARRLQVIAPKSQLRNIPGIVLIDEIELNLHPAWQSGIIPALKETFEKCQFVVSTHSPQVLSSIRSEHVRIVNTLEGQETSVTQPKSTKGRTSNYLLEGIFGATERFAPIEELIEKFNDAIDHNKALEARELFEKITNEVEGDAPDLLVLKKRLKAVEALR